jgi:hypothetical protein
MQSWLTGLAIGAVVSFLAGRIVRWWKANKAGVEKSITGIDDWIERKLKVDIPDRWQARYDASVAGAVAWVDNTFGDAKSTRQLLRKVVALTDPGKRAALIAEIEDLVEAWRESWAQHLEGATPDLRGMVNEAKEEIAVRIVGSRVATAKATPPPDKAPLPTEPEIRSAIRAAAPGVIADHSSEPVTPALLEKLLQESRARQAKLAGKV